MDYQTIIELTTLTLFDAGIIENKASLLASQSEPRRGLLCV